MKILIGREWRDGFLDYYRSPEEYRIQVLALRNLEKLEDIYFIRPKSINLIWNYLHEVGPKGVLRKILSRSRERYRNEKYISCGVGKVIESSNISLFPIGQLVVFLATSHPPCVERIVVPKELMVIIDQSDMPYLPSNVILYHPISDDNKGLYYWLSPIRGWSTYSGTTLSPTITPSLMQQAIECIRQTNWKNAQQLRIDEQGYVMEFKETSLKKRSSWRKSAVLFGYGNYAKVNIIPNLKSYLSIDCIHEIDPTQILLYRDLVKRYDTSPVPRSDKKYDVFLIAGFHHTHAPLAIYALQRNVCAVVEKPIVVNKTQLTHLIDIMKNSTGRLFSGFHKRYLPFNKIAIQDLGVGATDPISYHCIIYEVPLPGLHWYRWPNSKSRLVSNGCHWIDHFLYLNNFCEVDSFDLVIAGNKTINCSISLKNGAFFTMVLTEQGSERIGVQDYIELRANGVTVKMVNGSNYIAEDKDRVIGKMKINKIYSYKAMYQQIGQRIVEGMEGDSLRSVEISGGLIISLENRLAEILKEEGINEATPTKS